MSKVTGSIRAKQTNARHGEIAPCRGSDQQFDLMSQKVLEGVNVDSVKVMFCASFFSTFSAEDNDCRSDK